MPTDLYYGILLFGLLCLVVRILYIRCSYSYSPSPIIRLFFHISTKKNNKSKMMHIFVKSFNFPHTYRQPSIHCHLKTYPNTGQRFVFFYGLQFFFLLMHGYQVGFTPSIVFGTFFFVILLFTVFFLWLIATFRPYNDYLHSNYVVYNSADFHDKINDWMTPRHAKNMCCYYYPIKIFLSEWFTVFYQSQQHFLLYLCSWSVQFLEMQTHLLQMKFKRQLKFVLKWGASRKRRHNGRCVILACNGQIFGI